MHFIIARHYFLRQITYLKNQGYAGGIKQSLVLCLISPLVYFKQYYWHEIEHFFQNLFLPLYNPLQIKNKLAFCNQKLLNYFPNKNLANKEISSFTFHNPSDLFFHSHAQLSSLWIDNVLAIPRDSTNESAQER